MFKKKKLIKKESVLTKIKKFLTENKPASYLTSLSEMLVIAILTSLIAEIILFDKNNAILGGFAIVMFLKSVISPVYLISPFFYKMLGKDITG